MSQIPPAENWTRAKLGDITEIVGGGTPSRDNPSYFQGTIPWVSPSDITKLNDIWIDETAESITENGLKKSSAVLLPVGTVLMTCRASFGLVAINRREMCTSQSLYSFICNPAFIFNEYLAYYLTIIRDRLAQLAGETTFKGISKSTLAKVEIPLPPLSEQLRIAAILREVDEIRKLRQQANEKMQKITEALFYNMFGNSDPHGNYPEGWSVMPLAKIVDSTQYGLSESLDGEGDVGVLRMGNITTEGWMDFTSLKYLPRSIVDMDKYDLRPGDILFNRTNSKELVGKTGLWEDFGGLYTFASYIIRVRLKENMASPEYIWALLNSPYGKQQVFSISKQAVNMANINTHELGSIQVVLPPFPLQEKFASYVRTARNQLRLNNLQTQSFDTLYQSLLTQAFNGELTASWRESHLTELAEAAEERDQLLKRLQGATNVPPPQQPDKSLVTNREELTKELTNLQAALFELIDGQRDNYFTATRVHEDIWLHMDEQGMYQEESDLEGRYTLFAGLDCSLDTTRRELHFLARMGLVKELTLPVEEESAVGIVHYITAYRSLREDDDYQQYDLSLLNPDLMREALT